ncbi:NB-ARC domain-containing protein [Crocosphaera sp.]|uniref:WD40 domain-containing protein n=1 Tax=Crocosphaera sp. TaxID=2729996 RepID=UPI002628D925|nr:NB-ARC domain-containing protein [Crocosphaera sp.]MDJ0581127.1 NB-ARC domain-containing protein [Crocosphaera sp.]
MNQDKLPTFPEIEFDWKQLQNNKDFREDNLVQNNNLLLKAEDLLKKSVEAGQYIKDPSERKRLEWIAQDLGDKIFWATKKYPRINLKSLVFSPNIDNKQKQNLLKQDWEWATKVVNFYGRVQEKDYLKSKILTGQCNLVSIHGMGGVGKTTLAKKIADEVTDKFEYVVWKTIRHVNFIEIIKEIIHFFQEHNLIFFKKSIDKNNVRDSICLILEVLKNQRCLLIFDNLESALNQDGNIGEFSRDNEGYFDLLQVVGAVSHKSCMILTSREEPNVIKRIALSSPSQAISFQLNGLNVNDAKNIFKQQKIIISDENEKTIEELISLYKGNPFFLYLLSDYISEFYQKDVNLFLQGRGEDIYLGSEADGIQSILDWHFNRLSDDEKEIILLIAINIEPISKKELCYYAYKDNIYVTIESLWRRSYIKMTENQELRLSKILEIYLIKKFINIISDELLLEKLRLFKICPIMKAISNESIRICQVKQIVQPIGRKLIEKIGSREKIEEKFKKILEIVRGNNDLFTQYCAGNIINLLCFFQEDLSKYDFSHIYFSQAYLQGANLQNTNFEYSSFFNCVFTQSFGSIWTIKYSPDGTLIATGGANGEVSLWNLSGKNQRWLKQEHTEWVSSIAFSPDGKIIASASHDQTIKLWNVQTGECFNTLEGHKGWVSSIAFSPDGKIIASASHDQTLKIWDITSTSEKSLLSSVSAHTNTINSVAFHPTAPRIITCSDDDTIKIWDIQTKEIRENLSFDYKSVTSALYSPDGEFLVSCSNDGTIIISSAKTLNILKVIDAHQSSVISLDINHDSKQLASCSNDHSFKIWELATGECLLNIQGNTHRILDIAISPNGKDLVSASNDRTAKIWNLETLKVSTLTTHQSWISSVAYSPDGKAVATASADQTIKLSDVKTSQLIKQLDQHTDIVRAVAFSPDGTKLVSGSEDNTVALWDITDIVNTQLLKKFKAHENGVNSVAFSPDGKIIATTSGDYIVKLWDSVNAGLIQKIKAHNSWVGSVAFSPDGKIIATASDDRTAKIWEIETGHLLKTFSKHKQPIRSVAFSPDGRIIATASDDQTITIWEIDSGTVLKTLEGHQHWVRSIVFSDDGTKLFSGSKDETIKIWNVSDGKLLNTLKISSPYENMSITGVKGLTTIEKATLKALGAKEKRQYSVPSLFSISIDPST